MRNIRTDLAIESAGDTYGLPGVNVNHWETGDISVTEVKVTDLKSAVQLGKPIGNYITLESGCVKCRNVESRLAMSALIGEEIGRMADMRAGEALVVGLGNRMVTPDSLGPLTVDRILVTRHIFSGMPEYAEDRMRSVCALAPGVLGVTGIETAEMLESIVRKIKPACVICVDALAARATGRIGGAIQITDTGIQPGSGVGNRRMALNRDTLGVDVIAVGMPTVIYAATLARDAFAMLDDTAGDEALMKLERELMGGPGGDMIVTPREIDGLIKDSAGMIAAGINRALQPELSDSEIMAMME